MHRDKFKTDETKRLTWRPARLFRRPRAGFGVAPILYMLGLIGVGAGVLFSSYSQSIKNNINMTNSFSVKSDLDGAATTLSATSVLSSDDIDLCPPQGGAASTNCAAAPTKMLDFYPALNGALSGDVHLPTSYTTASSGGAPAEVGVLAAGSGVKQLDPWGHYYVVCRWENSATSSSPAFEVISAGPSGIVQTQCGATTAGGDNQIISMNAANAVNRAAIWQTGTLSTGSAGVYYGKTGYQLGVDTSGDLIVPGNVSVGSTSGGGAISAVSGAFSGGLTAEGTNFQVLTGGALSASNGAFVVNTDGTFSGVGGLFTVGAGGALTAANGLFGVNSSGDLSIGASGSPTFKVTAATGDTGITGAVSITNSSSAVSLQTNGYVNIGTGASALGIPVKLLTVGKFVGSTYPFYVDQSGNVTANAFNGTLNGSVNGGTVSATSITDSGTLAAGATTITGVSTLNGNTNVAGNIVATGTITADAGFIGNMTIGSGGVSFTGVVPLANGGTSYAASSYSDLLNHMGVTTSGFLNLALLQTDYIPGADLVNNSVTITQLDTTGVSAGSYNWGVVGVDGRVTYAQNVSSSSGINDGNGDSVVAGTTGIIFTVGSAEQGIWTTTGLGIGTTNPGTKLDVNGNIRIEDAAGASGSPNQLQLMNGATSERWAVTTDNAAEGGGNSGSDFILGSYSNSGISLGTPLTITRTGNATFSGTVTATEFFGSGAGLTGIGTGSITGILSTSNGGTGTGTTFTQGSIVFAGASGIYTQDNSNFFWDDSDVRLGIGTATPANAIDVNTGGGLHLTSGVPSSTSMALYNNAGVLTWNGIPIDTGGGAVTGSGMTNYVARWVTSTSLGTGVIYDNDTAVGIGTTTLTGGAELTVVSASTANPAYGIDASAPNSSNSIGVNGTGTSTGVKGTSGSIGVQGLSTSGGGYGTWGYDYNGTGAYGSGDGPSGVGVYGLAGNTSGTTYGVQGNDASPSGYAGYFANSAASGSAYGVFASTGSSSGYAIYASGGQNYFSGFVGIGSVSPIVSLDLSQEGDALALPGNNGSRPTGGHLTAGEIRYNSSIPGIEAYYNSGWNTLLGGGSFGTLTPGDFCTAASSTQIQCTTATINLGTQVSGTLQAAQFPALTGDVTTSAGSLATTVAKIQGTTVTGTTGTGSAVLNASPTLIGTTTIGTAMFTGNVDVESNPIISEFTACSGACSSTADPAQYLLVKMGGSYVLRATTTDTSGIIGISVNSTNQVAVAGQYPCTFDGGVTYGDYVSISTVTNGDCTDAGSSLPSNGKEVVGQVQSATNASAGTYTVALGFGYGSNKITGSGTTNYVAVWTGTRALGTGTLYDNGTDVGIGTASPIVSLDLSKEGDALALPGNGGSRPTGGALTAGEIRYNSSTPGIEAYYNSTWNSLLGGGSFGTLTTGDFCTAASSTQIQCTTATISLGTQVSGTLQAAQFPALTGDVTTSAGSLATTVAKIQGTTVTGTTGTGSAVLNASPTLTGLTTIGSATFTGNADVETNAVVSEFTGCVSLCSNTPIANKLAKISVGGPYPQETATSDTGGVIGIAAIGGSTTDQIAVSGEYGCIFDGGVTYGDYVTISATTAGDCNDAGGSPSSTTKQIIGRVASPTNASAGTYTVAINTVNSASSLGSVTGSGTANYVARWTSSTVLGTGVLYDNGTDVGIASTSPIVSLDLSQEGDAIALPGYGGSRPTGGHLTAGEIRYNSSTPGIEAYYNSTWNSLLGGGSFGTLTTGDFCTAASSTQIQCTTATINLGTQVSGTLQAAQFPALTGDVTTSAGSLATTVAKIQGTTVTGTTGTGSAVLNASPTLIGTTTIGTAMFTGNVDVESNPIISEFTACSGACSSTADPAQYLLVKMGGSYVLRATTTDTSGIIGISVNSTNQVAVAGQYPCTFDGGVTYGDYVSISTVTNGDCTDAGSSLPSNGKEVVGQVQSATNASAGTYTVALGFGYGSNKITGSGTTNYVAVWTGTRALGTGTLYDNGTDVGIGTASPIVSLDLSKEGDALALPGNGGSRPTGGALTAGEIRYNSSTPGIEAYYNSTWNSLLGGGSFGTLTTGDFCTAASSTQIQCTTATISLGTQVSGTLQAAQFPALTGDVTTSAGSLATTVAKIQGTTVSGTTGTGNVVFSASPTLTGTITAAAASFSGIVDLTSNAAATEIANAGTGGTAANKLAILTTSNPSTAVKALTTTTDGVVGIVIGGAGTSGNAQLAIDGQASCVFDGATTAGDFVTISTGTAGDCTDAGATRSTTSQNIGRVLSTNGGGGTYVVDLGLAPSAASSGAVSGTGTTNYAAIWKSSTTLGTSLLYDNGTGVGIGTANPTAPLYVVNSASASSSGEQVAILGAPEAGGTLGSGPYLSFYGNGSTETGRVFATSEGTNKGGLSFYTYNSGLGERVRISATGLVGINSTLPIVSLDMSQQGDAIALPGNGGSRPTGGALTAGEIRYNSSTPGIEAYYNSTWNSLLGGGSFGTLTTGDFCTAASSTQIQCTTATISLGTQVSGTLQAAQFPALTGDVTTSAGSLATTVAKIQGTTVSGTTGTGNVVFSASPTLTGTALTGNIDAQTNSYITEIANNGSAATVANKLAILSSGSPSTATKALTATTDGVIGIVVAGAGTSGNAQIAISGQANCTFDAGTTAGHFATISSTTAGDCTDAGATRSSTKQTIGIILSTSAIAAITAVDLAIAPSTTGAVTGTGTTNYVARWTSSTALGTGILYDNGTAVGIGTASPGSFALNVQGSANATGSMTAFDLYAVDSSVNDLIDILANQSGVNFITSDWESSGPYLPLALSAREVTTDLVLATNGNIGIGSASPIVSLDLSKEGDALALPGNGGSRPTGGALTAGEIRYNSSTPGIEAYYNSTWNSLLGGGSFGTLTTGDFCTAASSTQIQCTTATISLGTQVSGTLQAAQFPALTGDVTTSAGSLATTVAKIQGTTVSGTTGTGNVVFSASPTLTGTITAAAASFSGIVDLTSNAAATEIANAGTGGTAANKLAILTTSNPSTAVKALTTTTDGVVGIVIGGAGTSGNAQLAIDGQASCVFDGATTAGDFVTISTGTAGDCTDAGATRSTTSQNIGRVLSTNGGGGTYVVDLGLAPSIGGSGAVTGSGTANYLARWTSSTVLGIGTAYDTGTLVGIGTTSPQAGVDINATQSWTSAGWNRGLLLRNNNNNVNALQFGYGGSVTRWGIGANGSTLEFFTAATDGTGSGPSYMLTISSSGQELIGNSNATPSNTASVYGNLSVGTSYVTIGAPTNGAIIQGNVGIGSSLPIVSLDLSQKGDALALPGNGGSRPTGGALTAGEIRYNSSTPGIEAYYNSGWNTLLGSSSFGTLTSGDFCTAASSTQIQCTTATISLGTQVSGTLQAAQFPALTGDVTTSAASLATTVAAIQGKTVSGTTGTTNVVFSASPTLTGTALTGNIDAQTNSYITEIANNGSAATVANKLAILSSGNPSTATKALTATTDGVIGIVVAGAGTSGNAQIAISGQASCVFDSATTAGDFVSISAGTAGDCTDAGGTRSTSKQTIGQVLSTNGGGGTYALDLAIAPSGGSGSITGTGTTNYVARWTSSTALGTGLIYDNNTAVGIGTTTLTAGAGLTVVSASTANPAYGIDASAPNSGNSIGVNGTGTSTGVKGSGASMGVQGLGNSGGGVGTWGYDYNGTGAYGSGDGPSGIGVYGTAGNSTGTTYGVEGVDASPTGYAGYFANSATSGSAYGVFASTGSSSGYAIYATGGQNYFSGSVGINSTSPIVSLDLSKEGDALALPGNGGSRPTGGALTAGEIRYNSSTPGIEAYYNSGWNTLLGSSSFGTLTSGDFCTAASSTQIQCTTATISLTTQVSGTLQAAQFPALTGDVTTSAASLATTVAAIQGTTVTGTTGTGSAVLNASPTLTGTALTGNIDAQTNSYITEIANNGSAATVVNRLAILSSGSPSTATEALTATTDGVIGVVVGGAGTSGNAQIATAGRATCTFDGVAAAGNFVSVSQLSPGECHATGTRSTTRETVGIVLSTVVSGNAAVALDLAPSIAISGTGTANYVARWTNTTALGTGLLYDDGTGVGVGTTTYQTGATETVYNTTASGTTYSIYTSTASTTGYGLYSSGANIGVSSTNGYTMEVPKCSGLCVVTSSKLVKLNSSGAATVATTSDTDGIVGIASSTIGTNVEVTMSGEASCIFDGPTTAGDFVTISGTTNGDCTDAGTTRSGSKQTIGQVLSTNGATGTYTVVLGLAPIGGSSASGSGVANYEARWINGSSIGTGVLYDNATNIGVGTTTLQTGAMETVLNSSASGTPYGVYSTSSAAGNGIGVYGAGGGSGSGVYGTGSNYGVYGTSSSSSGSGGGGYFTNTNTGYSLITGTGYVGIATATPVAPLDVNGGAYSRVYAAGAQSAGGTLTPNFSTSNSITATFGAGNLTLANPTNISAGQTYLIQLTQDSGGSRTISSWGSYYKFAGGTKPTLSTGVGAIDVLSCWASSTTTLMCVLAIANAS